MKEFLVKHPFISLLMLDVVVTGIENVVITISEAVTDKKYEKKKESFADGVVRNTVEGYNAFKEEKLNGQESEGNDEAGVCADREPNVEQRCRLGFH